MTLGKFVTSKIKLLTHALRIWLQAIALSWVKCYVSQQCQAHYGSEAAKQKYYIIPNTGCV